MFKFILLSISVSILTAASKSDTVYVNFDSNTINAAFIQNYTHAWTVSYFSKEGKQVGERTWTDVVRIKKENSKLIFHRVQELYDKTGSLSSVWTNLAELPSLKPLQNSDFSTNGRFTYVEFDNKKVSGRWTGAKKELLLIPFEENLTQAVYDWSLYGILLAALPFEKGLVFKLPIYKGIRGMGGLDYLIVDVIGEKKIGQFDTWEMKTNKNLSFWVTKKQPYVINLELKNPNGFKIIWESKFLK